MYAGQIDRPAPSTAPASTAPKAAPAALSERAYYLRRKEQELQAAHYARCREARRAHEQMARAYQRLFCEAPDSI